MAARSKHPVPILNFYGLWSPLFTVIRPKKYVSWLLVVSVRRIPRASGDTRAYLDPVILSGLDPPSWECVHLHLSLKSVVPLPVGWVHLMSRKKKESQARVRRAK